MFGHSSGAVLALRAVASGLPVPRLAVYEPPFIVEDSRPPLPDDYVARLDELIGEGRRGDAAEYFMTAAVGIPAEYVAGMRSDPSWQATEAVAHTIAYDGRVVGDTMSGNPLSPDPWHAISIPTLVMDGGASPDWQHNGTRALAAALPDAQRRTLEGQDHGPADAILAPMLVEFFTSESAVRPK